MLTAGHALSLSQSLQPPDPVDRRRAGAAQALQTQMAVRRYKGEAVEKTMDWASRELEGFMRN
jgi:hypothetical protein